MKKGIFKTQTKKNNLILSNTGAYLVAVLIYSIFLLGISSMLYYGNYVWPGVEDVIRSYWTNRYLNFIFTHYPYFLALVFFSVFLATLFLDKRIDYVPIKIMWIIVFSMILMWIISFGVLPIFKVINTKSYQLWSSLEMPNISNEVGIWSVYENSKHEIQLNYPSDWIVDESGSNITFCPKSRSNNCEVSLEGEDSGGGISFKSIYKNEVDKMLYGDNIGDGTHKIFNVDVIGVDRSKYVGGDVAIIKYPKFDSFTRLVALVNVGNKWFVVFSEDEMRNVFDKMFSSIKHYSCQQDGCDNDVDVQKNIIPQGPFQYAE